MKQFSINDFLKTADPATIILINDLYLRYGDNIGFSQYYYCNATTSPPPFNTVDARTAWLALEIEAGYDSTTFFSNTGALKFYNAAGIVFFAARNNAAAVLAGPTHYYQPNSVVVKNIVFFKAVPNNYNSLRFIGFKISI